MRTHIKTYGCTLNQADSEIMEGLLSSSGMVQSGMDGADVVVVNTCTVKTPTQQKILHLLEKLERQGRKVVVTGCLASENPELVKRYAPGASIVTTSNIRSIAAAVQKAAVGEREVFDAYTKEDKLIFFNPGESVIAKVPVSEGCLSNCSFCATKRARGPLNSFAEGRIVAAVEASVRMGAKEIQLTSQDMGAYGLDRGTNIAMLMERLAGIEGNFRIRIGMLNPEHLHGYFEEFIAALRNERFYRFVHLPVQSGSNRVLGAMKRHYTIEQFNHYVDALRVALPDITIETDVIVGFPTETDGDFGQTLDYIRNQKPNVVNRCRFWARPHTAASGMEQLPNDTIIERSGRLTSVVRHVQKEINETSVGSTCDVVVTEFDNGSICARADNYKKVILRSDERQRVALGEIVRVRIDSASCNVLYGTPIHAVAMEKAVV